MPINPGRFETELVVRPDDIDMNNHVHSSRYIDYLLAARFDQMRRCYKMPMEEFIERGFGWVMKTFTVEFLRQLRIGETVVVRTWLEVLERRDVLVKFEMVKKETGKLSAEGNARFTLIDLKTGRPAVIPPDIIDRYSI